MGKKQVAILDERILDFFQSSLERSSAQFNATFSFICCSMYFENFHIVKYVSKIIKIFSINYLSEENLL